MLKGFLDFLTKIAGAGRNKNRIGSVSVGDPARRAYFPSFSKDIYGHHGALRLSHLPVTVYFVSSYRTIVTKKWNEAGSWWDHYYLAHFSSNEENTIQWWLNPAVWFVFYWSRGDSSMEKKKSNEIFPQSPTFSDQNSIFGPEATSWKGLE